MARNALASGALVRLFDEATLPITIYSFACREARADEPRIRAFRDWLFAEAMAEGTLAAKAPEVVRARATTASAA
jgi:LysR family glycine cleavage system transcriptional activator